MAHQTNHRIRPQNLALHIPTKHHPGFSVQQQTEQIQQLCNSPHPPSATEFYLHSPSHKMRSAIRASGKFATQVEVCRLYIQMPPQSATSPLEPPCQNQEAGKSTVLLRNVPLNSCFFSPHRLQLSRHRAASEDDLLNIALTSSFTAKRSQGVSDAAANCASPWGATGRSHGPRWVQGRLAHPRTTARHHKQTSHPEAQAVGSLI